MAPKKSALRSLRKKGVTAKKAGGVKGGAPRRDKDGPGKLAANHNQVVRKLKNLGRKVVSRKKSDAVKGGKRKNGKLAGNHNQVLRTR